MVADGSWHWKSDHRTIDPSKLSAAEWLGWLGCGARCLLETPKEWSGAASVKKSSLRSQTSQMTRRRLGTKMSAHSQHIITTSDKKWFLIWFRIINRDILRIINNMSNHYLTLMHECSAWMLGMNARHDEEWCFMFPGLPFVPAPPPWFNDVVERLSLRDLMETSKALATLSSVPNVPKMTWHRDISCDMVCAVSAQCGMVVICQGTSLQASNSRSFVAFTSRQATVLPLVHWQSVLMLRN